MEINPKKSGILEFFGRNYRSFPSLNLGTELEGIPVVAFYKSGDVDKWLTLDRQIEAITQKSNWISTKLWHVLRKVSVSYRINLWTIFIRPLFELLTLFYALERSVSNRSKVERALRVTFKKFTQLKNNIKDKIVNDLMKFDINARAEMNLNLAREKWESRVQNRKVRHPNIRERWKRTIMILLIPREVQEILNLMTALCPKCPQKVCSPEHLKASHQLWLPTYKEIMPEVEKNKRSQYLSIIKEICLRTCR